MAEHSEEIASVRALIVNRLRGNGGERGAGELADDVLDALGLERVGVATEAGIASGSDFVVTPRESPGDVPLYRLAGLSGSSGGEG